PCRRGRPVPGSRVRVAHRPARVVRRRRWGHRIRPPTPPLPARRSELLCGDGRIGSVSYSLFRSWVDSVGVAGGPEDGAARPPKGAVRPGGNTAGPDSSLTP